MDGGFQASTRPPVQPGETQPGDARAPEERKSARRIFSIKVRVQLLQHAAQHLPVYNTQRIIFLFTSALV